MYSNKIVKIDEVISSCALCGKKVEISVIKFEGTPDWMQKANIEASQFCFCSADCEIKYHKEYGYEKKPGTK